MNIERFFAPTVASLHCKNYSHINSAGQQVCYDQRSIVFATSEFQNKLNCLLAITERDTKNHFMALSLITRNFNFV